MLLRIIGPDLTQSVLNKLTEIHHINHRNRASTRELKDLVANHGCKDCSEVIFIFDLEPGKHEQRKSTERLRKAASKLRKRTEKLGEDKSSFNSSAALREQRKNIRARNLRKRENKPEQSNAFPPKPAPQALQHKIMCEDVRPDKVEELGCAVCGELTPNYELTPTSELQDDWNILERPGVTR
ncbi:hypothetical protein B0H13DRAFT_1602131 [Mycena leptocephala]|nr:hypothetical protein B0H13DRAFT_1602131 [Mycena leptocephala]